MANEFSDNVEFPSFDTSKATDQFRVFAERGVEQSKQAYERMKSGAEWAQKTFETSAETTRAAAGELSLKTIAAMRANTLAGFDHLESLARARTFAEVVELQSNYFRSSFDTFVSQGKDLQAAATKAAEDVSRPVKENFESAMRELKVA
ncbi:MAG: phasin [Methylobacterium mesophilicum]|nr:phasin [Methylobacterium mesophilicum]